MWIETLNKWKTENRPCVLATIVKAEGSTPRGVGTHLVIRDDGSSVGTVGGGPVEHTLFQQTNEVLRRGETQLLRFGLYGGKWQVTDQHSIESACGGYLEILLEPILPSIEIVLFGGGHIALKLAALTEVMELPCRVYDNRPEFANKTRFPMAKSVVAAPYEELDQHIALGSASYCLILTHGHKHDRTVLERLLPQKQLPYIGMIGSATKIDGIIQALANEGFFPDERLFSPVGLDIGHHTPQEIALSILSEIHLLSSGGTPQHCRVPWHEIERFKATS